MKTLMLGILFLSSINVFAQGPASYDPSNDNTDRFDNRVEQNQNEEFEKYFPKGSDAILDGIAIAFDISSAVGMRAIAQTLNSRYADLMSEMAPMEADHFENAKKEFANAKGEVQKLEAEYEALHSQIRPQVAYVSTGVYIEYQEVTDKAAIEKIKGQMADLQKKIAPKKDAMHALEDAMIQSEGQYITAQKKFLTAAKRAGASAEDQAVLKTLNRFSFFSKVAKGFTYVYIVDAVLRVGFMIEDRDASMPVLTLPTYLTEKLISQLPNIQE